MGEVGGVGFGQRAAGRAEGWWWYSWRIGEGWIVLEGKKPEVTASLGKAGEGRNNRCPLSLSP